MISPSEDLDTTLRTVIYAHFMTRGIAPTKENLVQALDIPLQEIEIGLHEMAEKHILVLQEGKGEILMAIPFSAVPTNFTVESEGVTYWANCMWDALGIPAALNKDSHITTNCPDCGDAIELNIEAGKLQGDQGVVHFLLPPKQWWDDIVFT
jgi:hypothetical protein